MILRQKELRQRIATLTEEIEELRSEKAHLLDGLSCKDDFEISRFKKEAADTEQTVVRLSIQEEQYTAELEKTFTDYNELKFQTKRFDSVELFYAREALRNECEEAAESRIHTAPKGINFWDMTNARHTVGREFDLYIENKRSRGFYEKRRGVSEASVEKAEAQRA